MFSLPCCAVKHPKEEDFFLILGVSKICIHALNVSCPSQLGVVAKETPRKNKDASHKAFVLCALIPLLTLTDGGAGAGHGALLPLLCSASWGFSLCHRLGFCCSCRQWGWHKPRSPAHLGACVSLLRSSELPPSIFYCPIPVRS